VPYVQTNIGCEARVPTLWVRDHRAEVKIRIKTARLESLPSGSGTTGQRRAKGHRGKRKTKAKGRGRGAGSLGEARVIIITKVGRLECARQKQRDNGEKGTERIKQSNCRINLIIAASI